MLSKADEMETISPAALNTIPSSVLRRARLSGINAAVYDSLKNSIKKIAAGESASSSITANISLKSAMGSAWKSSYSASDLGVSSILSGSSISSKTTAAMDKLFGYNPKLVLNSLLTDLPYELYWFDKTTGCKIEDANISAYSATSSAVKLKETASLTFRFHVIPSYSSSGNTGTTSLNTAKTKAAKSALNTANSIITANKSKSDYEKLKAYKNKICELVSYNTAAAGSSAYSDAFQMIYVFDGNSSTNVVCEGYAKAFKYLCDNTSFSSSKIYCQLATGNMSGGTGSGEHMWNIVHMDDGKNYIVDVTNCDSGTIGNSDKLFLSGATKLAANRYRSVNVAVTYEYNTNTTGQFSSSELAIAAANYKPSSGGGSGSGGGNSGSSSSGSSGSSGGNSGSSSGGSSGSSGGNSGSSSGGSSGSSSGGSSGSSGGSSGSSSGGSSSSSGGSSGSSGGSSDQSAIDPVSPSDNSGYGSLDLSYLMSEANKRARENSPGGSGVDVTIVIGNIKIRIKGTTISITDKSKSAPSSAVYKVKNDSSLTFRKSLVNAKNVTVPENITIGNNVYKITEISKNAFKDCTKTRNIIISGSISKMDKGAFEGTSSLKTITIKASNKKEFNKAAKAIKKSSSRTRKCKFVYRKS